MGVAAEQQIRFDGIKAIITDIEGTTGSIDFVHQVLFPYAKEHLPEFVRQNAEKPEVAEQLEAARQEMARPHADAEAIIAQLLQWIADDKKVTPLKALQGLVWEAGYSSGDYTGHVYPDAYESLKAWKERVRLFIYSSGSVYAQKLLFGFSDFGDLTPWFEGYFDTKVGGKREQASYQNIQSRIGLPAEQLLFLSDVVEELDAAKAAGFQTVQLVRTEGMITGDHPQVSGFSQIEI
ncbi:MAG: acireductone synthase [Oceanospirillum sp.]|nr:acireductone synthase [Oceanospirillum sp.]